jgi:small-conductance mechanosensitive channel
MFAPVIPETFDMHEMMRDWRQDTHQFVQHDLPKIVLVLLLAFVFLRILSAITGRMGTLKVSDRYSDMRARQVKTMAGVIGSVGKFAIFFVASLEILSQLGLNLGPLLASAGIAGLAIGFGAQTLVKDVINGFFILLENQYDVGDTVRAAGVKGAVEDMSLRRTVLRDDDGTVHTIPNSEIKLVSNMTRDWSQVLLRATVAASEPAQRVTDLLSQIGASMAADPQYAGDFTVPPRVLGIDRIANGEAEYLVIARTRPGRQFDVVREMRRRIKEAFESNQIKTGAPGRVFVAENRD